MNLPTYKGKQLIPFSPINPLSLSSTVSPTFLSASASANTANANGRYPKAPIDDESIAMMPTELPQTENGMSELHDSNSSLSTMTDVTQTRAGIA